MLSVILLPIGAAIFLIFVAILKAIFFGTPGSSSTSYSQDTRTPKEREMDRLRSENERLRREKKALEEKEERERFFVEASIAGVFDDDL